MGKKLPLPELRFLPFKSFLMILTGEIQMEPAIDWLLDSFICAIIPILCVTQEVSELNVIPKESLHKMLDNVAYIMPLPLANLPQIEIEDDESMEV